MGLIKNIVQFAQKEISAKINQKKDFSSQGIPGHDPDYIYDLYTREFSGMNSQNLLQYIDLARRGCPFYFYKYFDAVSKRDTRIRLMLRKLKVAVLMEQFRVSGEWEEGVKFCEDVIAHMGKNLYKFFIDAVSANTKGLTRFEISYAPANGRWMPSEVRAIPSFIYLYNDKARRYAFLDVNQFDQVRLKSALSAEPDRIDISKFPQVEINPLRSLDVFAVDGDEENAFMNGITIALLFAYYYKGYNIKDMNIFLERFAAPTTKMKYDPLNSKTKDELIKAYGQMKAHGAIIYPDGTDIELLNDSQKGQAGNLYLTAINYWNSEITILFAGEEETTQMGSKGSMAALQVKQKISDLIVQMNLMTCASAFNDLLRRLIDINFPNPKEYPEFEFIKISTLNDKKIQSEINKNLKEVGVRPTMEEMEEQQGVELEEYTAPANNAEGDPEEEENEDENEDENDDGKDDPDDKPDNNSDEEEFEMDFIDKLFKSSQEEASK